MSDYSTHPAETPLPTETPLPRKRLARPRLEARLLRKPRAHIQSQLLREEIPMWFTIDTGSGTSKCFTQKDVQNFGFTSWLRQVPDCTKKGACSLNCQACAQSVGCSGQYCPSLRQPRKLYSLGPKVSIKARGDLATQPYTFPLPLDYGGKNPVIPLNLMPWEGVP